MPALPSSHPEQFVQGAPVLHVQDVKGTAAFYRDILGFTWDFGDETYAVVWRDNAAIHFVRDDRNPSGVHLFQWIKNVDTIINGHMPAQTAWADLKEYADFNKDLVERHGRTRRDAAEGNEEIAGRA